MSRSPPIPPALDPGEEEEEEKLLGVLCLLARCDPGIEDGGIVRAIDVIGSLGGGGHGCDISSSLCSA